MTRVRFISVSGAEICEVDAPAGTSLLALAQENDQPLEGTCEGQMACSTCHVIVAADWFGKLPTAGADEEDMLDLAAGVARTSRLACQIELTEALDGLEVRIPGESHDMQRR